jgi:hypothetical protein
MSENILRISQAKDPVIPATSMEARRNVVLGDNFNVGAGLWARSLQVDGPGTVRGPIHVREDMVINVAQVAQGDRQLFLGGISLGRNLTCVARDTTGSPVDPENLYMPLGIKGEVMGSDVSISNAVVLGNVTCENGRIRNSVIMGSIVADEDLVLENCVCFSAKAQSVKFAGKVGLFFPFVLSNGKNAQFHFEKLTRKDGSMVEDERLVRCLPLCATKGLGCAGSGIKEQTAFTDRLICPFHLESTCPRLNVFMKSSDVIEEIEGKGTQFKGKVLTLADRLLDLTEMLKVANNQARIFKQTLLADLLTKGEFNALQSAGLSGDDKQLLMPIMDEIETGLPVASREINEAMDAGWDEDE